MKRRAAVEPTIGHVKIDYRLERNCLKGTFSCTLNALFRAAAMNLKKLLGSFLVWLLGLIAQLFPTPRHPHFNHASPKTGVLQRRLMTSRLQLAFLVSC